METWQKGKIAVQKVILRAIEKGLLVSQPVVESSRYDLVLDQDGELLRAQIKWASSSGDKDFVEVGLRKFSLNGNQRVYGGDIDLLLVYLPAVDMICAFQPEHYAGKKSLSIRFTPPKNNQKNVLLAHDYRW